MTTDTNTNTLKATVEVKITGTERQVINRGKAAKTAVMGLIAALVVDHNGQANPAKAWTNRMERLLTEETFGVLLSDDYAQRIIRMAKFIAPRCEDLTKPEAKPADNVAAVLSHLTSNYTLSKLREEQQAANLSGRKAADPKPGATKSTLEEVRKENEELKAKLAKAAEKPAAVSKSVKAGDIAKAVAKWHEQGVLAKAFREMDGATLNAISIALNAVMLEQAQPTAQAS